ncbi:hypothetical protein GE107_25235 [Cohnella sp. CFH 77786]|uniref:hypothetical protein n=1 Tax=Cohnella sp. CFH 77786 TaxID=2662265 RepID=UPI001C60A2EC|nr:hypothetical protein [Cohnella sp. CFH 77786]MBW5449334.1 hypothetical protein [Cohnella sp. CFH 77786]
MREQLQALEGKRSIFTGEYVKVSGKKEHNGAGPAILLRNIKDQDGQLLADHLWVDHCQEFDSLELKEGEQIIFRARVGQYRKGKHGQLVDYTLHYPSNIQRLGEHAFRGKRRKRGKAKGDSSGTNPDGFFLLSS